MNKYIDVLKLSLTHVLDYCRDLVTCVKQKDYQNIIVEDTLELRVNFACAFIRY